MAIRRGHADDIGRVVVVLGDGRAFTNRGALVEVGSEEDEVAYTAGNGLTLSGTEFSINTAVTVDKTTSQTLTSKTISQDSNTLALTPRLAFSEVELGEVATISTDPSNYTVGTVFLPIRKSMSCTGMRFYWDGAASKTIKCSLWDTAGTRLQTVNVAATTAGIYTATWSAAETLTAFTNYRVSTWVNDGSKYLYITAANISAETATLMLIGDMNTKIIGHGLYRYTGCYAAGDAHPSTNDATSVFMTEPTFAAM